MGYLVGQEKNIFEEQECFIDLLHCVSSSLELDGNVIYICMFVHDFCHTFLKYFITKKRSHVVYLVYLSNFFTAIFPVQINKNSRKWTLFSTNTNNKLLQVTFIWRVAPLYFACQELDFRGFWFQSNSPFEVKELIDCWAGNIPMRLTCPSYHKRVYLHSFLIIQDIAMIFPRLTTQQNLTCYNQ